ncbi:MAG: hypothetical protein AYK19_07235 [Theionarchaea archaeon DG-70-1]|nr:MAG: hypothetical protein AYK19_07235 [Theionarchaea archaeon DG-70-1]
MTSGEYNDETVAPKFPRKGISTYGSRTRRGFSKKEEKEYDPFLDFLRTNNFVKKEHVEIREENFTYCNFNLLASINGHSYLIELETRERTIGSIGALSILEFGCNYFHDENKNKIEGVLIISNSRLMKDIKNIESEFSRYTRNKTKIISRDDCIEQMTKKDVYDD